jgi:hypothetical protein
MLRDMVGVKTRSVISLNKPEARLIVLVKGQIIAVEMIEYSEFHSSVLAANFHREAYMMGELFYKH